MADNVGYTPGTGAKVATREVTYSGETALAQVVGLATFSGSDDAKTITDIDASNPLPVNQSGVSATGSLGALNATVALSLNGASGWAVDLRGTFTATVTFQGTIDGTNWFTIAMLPAGGTVNIASVTTATAPGQWWGNANGLQQVRATATAYTSGTVTVVLRAMQAAGVVTAIISGATTGADVGIQYRATATGAGTITNLNCPATPAVQTIKGSAGRLMGMYLVNTNATIRWLKIFNIVSPTLASSTATMRIPLPQNQPVYFNFEGGTGFATAITCAICSTSSLTDATGAVTLDDVTGFTVHA
jgi:hypothetical protein